MTVEGGRERIHLAGNAPRPSTVGVPRVIRWKF